MFKEEITDVENEVDIDLIANNTINIDGYEAIEVIYIYDNNEKIHRIMTTLKGNIMSIESRSKKGKFR